MKKAQEEETGHIFDVQRCSVHDGPGIRTTVFLKGCPLHCSWCHNPESITSNKLISFLPDKCIGCGYCFEVCPNKAHAMVDNRHVLDREKCAACGLCTKKCYSGALEIAGREVGVEEVLGEALRDRPFYDSSGGGITLSGGEPLLQVAFCEELLRKAKEAGLHCCVETSGYCDYERLNRIAPFVNLFLYDWKETDPQRHIKSCGVGNEKILANLRVLHDAGRKILLRCPIIPGVNDREDHFAGIAALAKSLPNLTGVELLAYHRLGDSKIGRFGLDALERVETESPSPEAMQEWICEMKRFGVQVVN